MTETKPEDSEVKADEVAAADAAEERDDAARNEAAVPDERPAPAEDERRYTSGFSRCPRCRMQVRRLELDIHLAHAHDIGPRPDKKPSRKGQRRR